MTTVQNGSTVTLHYVGTLDDGSEFDNSRQREPLTTKTGEGNLIPGFEAALVGMSEGETKTFTIECADAYGEINPEAKTVIAKEHFPDDFPLQEGMPIPLMSEQGHHVMGTVTEITDTEVTADLNHPLAGKDLTFEIELLSVEDGEQL